ncbi:MAG: hypothetical protein QXT19_04180 [Candidatus Woesearchaeota archaeon]
MDAETAEKINQLAKNLKDLHLASSSEEAYARAKEIILNTATQGQEKSIREMMQEAGVTEQDLQRAKELLRKEEVELNLLKRELEELKQKQAADAEYHEKHVKKIEKLDEELVDKERDVGVVEENIDVAEEVQKEETESK